MTRKSVRHAAADYLSSPGIPGIGKVYPSPPKVSKASDAFEDAPPGTPSGSVLYVEVMDSREVRIALGGPQNGTKTVQHVLRLHLMFRSRQPLAEDAMDDHDDILDSILSRLRVDRTLGTNGKILMYGQDDQGITYATGMPKTSGTGSTLIWSLIEGNAMEIFSA